MIPRKRAGGIGYPQNPNGNSPAVRELIPPTLGADNPDDGVGFANAANQTANRQFPHLTSFNWDDGFVYTAPVGKFKPNAWGLHDMIANALEWCSDYYGEYPDGFAVARFDPKGPAQGDKIGIRVLRCGSWLTARRTSAWASAIHTRGTTNSTSLDPFGPRSLGLRRCWNTPGTDSL